MSSFKDIPVIDTVQMDQLLAKLTPIFKGVRQTGGYWICGRSSKFGFRPSFNRDWLPKMIKEWIQLLETGYIVITPLIFYTCDKDDPENVLVHQELFDKEDFLVNNHYNVLISHLTKDGTIYLERYEPADTTMQNNLDDRLKKLFIETFAKVSSRKVDYRLISQTGLQAKYKDTTLCGHHIVYWIIYRLKYGDDKSISLITDPSDTGKGFLKFCSCLNEFQESCAVQV
jgi:hypothetical protein